MRKGRACPVFMPLLQSHLPSVQDEALTAALQEGTEATELGLNSSPGFDNVSSCMSVSFLISKWVVIPYALKTMKISQVIYIEGPNTGLRKSENLVLSSSACGVKTKTPSRGLKSRW